MKKAKIESGYSESYAESSHHKKTKGYQEAVIPVLERYQKELQAILDAMELKDKNGEEYKVLVDSADKTQKQIQLLSGGATERNILKIELSGTIAKKRQINETPSSPK